MARTLETTVQENANILAVPKGNQIDRYKPDARELVEYSPELASFILREIGKGRSLITVCQDEGMPHHASFLRWCHEMPELMDRYCHAKKLRAHAKAEEVSALTDALDPVNTGKNEAYVTDIKARNLLRIAELGDPASFSPKMQMMHHHSGGVVSITMDLSAPQSRPIIDTTASQVPETPQIDAPQVGDSEKKGEGGGGSTA